MPKRTISGTMLFLLLVFTLALAFNIQPAKAQGTIYIRADGSIDPPDAPISTFDNVTYTLTGNVTVNADGIVFERDHIVLDGAGHTFQGSGNGAGIYLVNRNNVTIKNVNAEAFVYGIYLYNSSDSSLFANRLAANSYGVMLADSSNNTITGNNVVNNGWGVQLYWSPNSMLRNNKATNNKYNFAVYGGLLSNYIQDIDTSNTINGKPIYYWINKQNFSVPFDPGYVAVINCTGITLKNLNLTQNGQGALLAYTTDSTITENTITDNWEGIYLDYSSNNTIYGNSITTSNMGIFLDDYSNNNTISRNNVTNGNHGIYLINHSEENVISENAVTDCILYGIQVGLSEYNIIYANNATNNRDGIYVYEAHNNLITQNLARGNTEFGIFLWNSAHNNLTENNMIGNWMDFGVNAAYLSGFYQNIDSSNLVNGKPLYYLMDLENATITQNDYPDIGCMTLVNASGVVIENLSLQDAQGLQLLCSEKCSLKNADIDNCTFAVWFLNSDKNTVSNVTLKNGYVGILFLNAVNNCVFESAISGNDYGIWSIDSNSNLIFHNGFLGNSQQVRSEGSADLWDNGYPSGGNYWSDYGERYPNATELDGSGVWNTPYVIDANNKDNYPLMRPYVQVLGDINDDRTVDIYDAILLANAFDSAPGSPDWNSNADLNGDRVVDILDAIILANNFGKT